MPPIKRADDRRHDSALYDVNVMHAKKDVLMRDDTYRRRKRCIAAAYLAFLVIAGAAPACAANSKAPPAPRRHNSRIAVEAVLQSFFSTGADAGMRPFSHALEGVTRVGWIVTQPLGSRWKVAYKRSYVDETPGRVTNAGGRYVYPPLLHDRIDDLHAVYRAGTMPFQVGYAYRQRICCPAASDPSVKAPATWHEFYVQTGARLGPFVSGFGKVFAAQARLSYMPRDAASGVAASLPTGEAAGTARFKFSGSLTAAAPIARSSPVSVFLEYAYASSCLENSPCPYLYNEVDFGLTRRVSSAVTSRLTISNKTQHLQGYPYVYPNAYHRAEAMWTTTVHLTP